MAQGEIHHHPAPAFEQIADAGDDDDAHARAGDRVLQRLGEILEDDNRFRAGILELTMELARRIERIAIDDNEPCSQRAQKSDRILQEVRHHQGDARADGKRGDIAKVAGESARQMVELAERHRSPHADEGVPVAILLDAGGEEFPDRAVGVRVDLGRHALGVGLQPNSFHDLFVPDANSPHIGEPVNSR